MDIWRRWLRLPIIISTGKQNKSAHAGRYTPARQTPFSAPLLQNLELPAVFFAFRGRPPVLFFSLVRLCLLVCRIFVICRALPTSLYHPFILSYLFHRPSTTLPKATLFSSNHRRVANILSSLWRSTKPAKLQRFQVVFPSYSDTPHALAHAPSREHTT